MWVNGLKTILSIAGKIKTVRKTKVSVTKKEGEWEYMKWLYIDFKLFGYFFFLLLSSSFYWLLYFSTVKYLLYLFSWWIPVIFPFGKTWMWKPMPTLQYSLLSLFIPRRYSSSLAVACLLLQELLLERTTDPLFCIICLLLLTTWKGAK